MIIFSLEFHKLKVRRQIQFIHKIGIVLTILNKSKEIFFTWYSVCEKKQ